MRVVGGLLMRVHGRMFPTAVRLEVLPRPACWRCGCGLHMDCVLVPGDDEGWPWVWCCAGCSTDEDAAALEEPPR